VKNVALKSRYGRDPAPGAWFYLVAVALILISLEGLLYLLLLRDTIGPFAFFGSIPKPTIDFTVPARVRIVMEWAPGEGSAAGERRIALWEKAALSAGLPVERFPISRLDKAPVGRDVLVLPAITSLDEGRRGILLRSINSGAGIVVSGSPGSLNPNGAGADHEFLLKLTGATAAETVAQGVCSVSFAGGRYFSDRVPAGRRLELPAQDLVVLRSKSPDAFLSDHRLRPLRGDAPEDAALAVHATRGAGRVVWFGFDETVRPEHPYDQQALEEYMAVSLRWAARQAVATRGVWPGDKPAAALIGLQLEHNNEGAGSLADLSRQESLPATFFVAAPLARANAALVKRVSGLGEVASAGDSEEPLVGVPPQRQIDRLRGAREQLEAVSGKEVRGLSPPQGLVNFAVISAMNDAGYAYVIGDRDSNQLVPDIVEFQKSALFPLQKAEITKIYWSGPDDLEMLAETPGDPVPRWLSDFRRVQDLGGLYSLLVHDDLLGASTQRGNLTRMVSAIKASPAWIATGGEITRWWSGRQKVEINLKPLGPRRLYLEVANKGLRDILDIGVSIFLPYRPQKVGIQSPVFRLATPEYRLDDREDLLRLRFKRLAQQTSYIYYITFDE
jgi:peptidoglycan/xylan/chitin deacetylase (PgdA/CDA1 family)